MAYTNRLGLNPIMMSNDIEIRSGTASSGETVANEYIALGYEPELGTQYLSTSGQLFIHHKEGVSGNTWYKVTDAPEPDLSSYGVTTTLTPALQPFTVSKVANITTTLAGSMLKVITSAVKSVGVTLGVSMDALVNPLTESGLSLSASMTAELTNIHEIFNVSLPLSVSYNKVANFLRGHSGTVTLGADVAITINP